MDMKEMLTTLVSAQQQNAQMIGELATQVKSLSQRGNGMIHPKQSTAFGLPNIREGEDPMSSRGYSMIKMLGMASGQLQNPKEQAKIELDLASRMHNALVVNVKGQSPYEYTKKLPLGDASCNNGTFLAPLSTSFLDQDLVERGFRHEMKSLMMAGTDGADFDEMKWIRQRQMQNRFGNVGAKTLSWLQEGLGASLVAPPEQGELIELLRNKEALVNAGARVVPLPPQGRMKYPRQTMASLTFWVGENAGITASDIGTGEITLQAKKLCVLIKAPNELIRFASPAAEALMRDDMTKSLALGLDLAGLEGAGTDHRPRGVLNFPGINNIKSSQPGLGAIGDRLVAEDFYRMQAIVEENNAEFEGYIMRPKTWYKLLQLRADAINQGDKQGLFLFSAIREPGEMPKPMIAGQPVTKSTQVSQVRAKTGGTANLTYLLGGMWSDMLIGMFGAIEFAATTLGDTPFQFDQTWVRGILSADIQARHEAAFCLIDNIDTTL